MKNYEINSRILDVWKRFPQHRNIPNLILRELKKNALVCIGFNPSLSPSGIKNMLKDTEYKKLSLKEIESRYIWKGENSIDYKFEETAEKNSIDNHQYFRQFKNLAREIGLESEFLDLFYIRETSQKEALGLLINNGELTEFAKKQLKITFDLLKSIKPKLILVGNSGASKIIRNTTKNRIIWDENHGFDWLKLDRNRTPIFFSSMLSGQRALDVESRKRLQWHLRQALITRA